MRNKAVFLDRDGVLNEAIIRGGKPFAPLSMAEVVIVPDALAALQRLKAAGFLLIGATNQPDVARSAVTREDVEAINKKIMEILPLDDMRVCFHDDRDACHCRKPLPGLLTDAAMAHDIDLGKSVMIGDRWKDVEAGYLAGCKTIWLRQDYYHEQEPSKPADYVALSLTEAVEWVTVNLY
jgi:D-glycero-D-manno-heptose 1,7-bisphosphate phosphatase